MNILRTGISILLSMLCISGLASVRTQKFNMDFSESDYTYSYNANGELIISSTKELFSFPETDDPGLPLLSKEFAVKGGSLYKSSSVNISRHLVRSNVTLAPCPLPIPTNADPQALPERTASYPAGVYPASSCRYATSTSWGGISVLHFLACPFVYDASKKELYFVDSMELTVVTEEELTANLLPPPSFTADFVKDLVENPEAVNPLLPIYPDTPTPSERIDYVIITNEALKPSFNKLLKWKKSKGLYSKIITVEEIESQYSGTDTPLKIKKCLHDLFINNSLKYVLLGGDDTIVPIRECKSMVNSRDKNGKKIVYTENKMPSDLYYACFSGNFRWDANGNGIFGECDDNIDMTPSVIVTRIPVRSTSDTDSFASKLINYERNPKWTGKMLMAGVKLGGMSKSRPDASDTEYKGDKLYDEYIKPYWSGERYKFYDTNTDFTGGAGYDVTYINLANQISDGYNFIDMITHGSETGWQMEVGRSYNSADGSKQTTNDDSNAIVTTTACNTNAFDSSQDPCLSESLIRNYRSGVMAYFGSSRYGWFRNNSDDVGTSWMYESYFYENVFDETEIEKKFGNISTAAKIAMISQSNTDNASRWLQFGLNPIGDPEMPIFTKDPMKFKNVKIYYSNGKVSIQTGEEKSKICFMSDSDMGAQYFNVYENTASIEKTDLPTVCSVCISKPGYVSKKYMIRIIQNETFTMDEDINYDVVIIGSSVTSSKNSGPVVFSKGTYNIIAEDVYMDSEVKINPGVNLNININSNYEK